MKYCIRFKTVLKKIMLHSVNAIANSLYVIENTVKWFRIYRVFATILWETAAEHRFPVTFT